jgi:hypothetical protein
VAGITNVPYATNVIIDLSMTNYPIWNITNTTGPVTLFFTNMTLVGLSFTVLIDGENIDGGTTTSNMPVAYTWPVNNLVIAQWIGYNTNTYVTSNKVLVVSGLVRRTNSVIISSRE